MTNKKEFERRLESEGMSGGIITNDDLVCWDCKHRIKPINDIFFDIPFVRHTTTKCKKFEKKPNNVLAGGRDEVCLEYEKESK